MPTNQNAYNSRVTDEALEKRFRDTFRSQGGAELVDDLYASGVIVPVVDFTAAATGQQLAENLQTAWDSATTAYQASNSTTNIITGAGFWQVGFTCLFNRGAAVANMDADIRISDGLSTNTIWRASNGVGTGAIDQNFAESAFIVFVQSGETVSIRTSNTGIVLDAWTRQIATVSGDLVNPTGFTSS